MNYHPSDLYPDLDQAMDFLSKVIQRHITRSLGLDLHVYLEKVIGFDLRDSLQVMNRYEKF